MGVMPYCGIVSDLPIIKNDAIPLFHQYDNRNYIALPLMRQELHWKCSSYHTSKKNQLYVQCMNVWHNGMSIVVKHFM